MNTDLLLSRLDKVKKTQKGWSARCPAHEDKTSSLSIAESNDRILIHCFAGCQINDVIGAIGLGIGDLFADNKSTRTPMAKRDRSELFASMAALSPSLAFDIEVVKIGLGDILAKGLMPHDVDTFMGSIQRTLNALDVLAKRPYR